MPEIYPKMTRSKLKSGARKTSLGKGRVPLPGVKTDAKDVKATDKCGYQANRELAEMIRKAVRAKKNGDKQRQAFRAWLAALSEQGPSALERRRMMHSCGCGCGCSS